MEDRELLARIDAHMKRGNELMDRGNELMGEVRRELALSREQAARHAEQAARHAELYADTRQFIREMTLRIERGGHEQVRELRRLGDRVEANEATLMSFRDSIGEQLRDLRDESRSMVRALLAVVDRLEGGGSAAGA